MKQLLAFSLLLLCISFANAQTIQKRAQSFDNAAFFSGKSKSNTKFNFFITQYFRTETPGKKIAWVEGLWQSGNAVPQYFFGQHLGDSTVINLQHRKVVLYNFILFKSDTLRGTVFEKNQRDSFVCYKQQDYFLQKLNAFFFSKENGKNAGLLKNDLVIPPSLYSTFHCLIPDIEQLNQIDKGLSNALVNELGAYCNDPELDNYQCLNNVLHVADSFSAAKSTLDLKYFPFYIDAKYIVFLKLYTHASSSGLLSNDRTFFIYSLATHQLVDATWIEPKLKTKLEMQLTKLIKKQLPGISAKELQAIIAQCLSSSHLAPFGKNYVCTYTHKGIQYEQLLSE